MEYVNDANVRTDFSDTEDARVYGINRLLTRLIRAHTGVIIDDISTDNVRFDKTTGESKLIDLAY